MTIVESHPAVARVSWNAFTAPRCTMLTDLALHLDRNLSTCCVPPIMTTEYLESRHYAVVAQFDGERYPVFVYQKKGDTP